MREDVLLLDPGPIPAGREVREATAAPTISHRSPAFQEVYARAVDGLEYVFTRSTPEEERTADGGRPLILNGTASMAMEAAVTNLVDPDGEVLVLENGAFGRRFRRMADRHAETTHVAVDWGKPFDLDAIAAAMTDDVDLVTMVHCETSTGLLNPVAEVGALAAEHDALFVVDAVSTIGGDEFRIDDWGVDVAVTAAQKALGAQPGIGALYASGRAIDALDGERTTLYQDLEWYVDMAADGYTPFTSAVPLFRALAAAVEDVREEGMPARIDRHRRQAAALREGFRAMGLEPFAAVDDSTGYANTVTAVGLPEPVRGNADPFFDGALERGVSVAGGHAHLAGEVFRVSNMGRFSGEELLRGVRTIGEALTDAGAVVHTEAGVDATRTTLEP